MFFTVYFLLTTISRNAHLCCCCCCCLIGAAIVAVADVDSASDVVIDVLATVVVVDFAADVVSAAAFVVVVGGGGIMFVVVKDKVEFWSCDCIVKETVWNLSEKVDHLVYKYLCVLQGFGIIKMMRNLAKSWQSYKHCTQNDEYGATRTRGEKILPVF